MKKTILKKMVENRFVSRRQFLVGSAGQILFLPPLLSLLSQSANAQTVAPARRLCLFPMPFGLHTSYLRPTATQLAGQLQKHNDGLHYALLKNLPKPVSFMVDADFNDLLDDMNLFFGLSLSHNGGHSAGQFCASGANISGDNTNRRPTYGKSMDVIVEQSAAFKAAFSGALPTLRVARSSSSQSWDRATGAVFPKQLPADTTDKALFDRVFGGVNMSSSEKVKHAARQNLITDAVLKDLQGLNNHKRISSVDKEMLDRYMSSINDLQKSIASSSVAVTCSKPTIVPQLDKDGVITGSVDQLFKNYNEIVTLAFACNQSRMLMFSAHYGASDGSSLPHHPGDDIGNRGSDPTKWYIKKIADLARRLKAFPDPSGNGNLLTHSLLIMQNEHSQRRAHSVQDIPVLTFGSLGGTVRSGLYLDYRLPGAPVYKDDVNRPYGRPIKQLHQTAMLGMGVTMSEYMQFGDGNGYGEFSSVADQGHHAQFVNTHNHPLEYFTK